MNFNLFSKFSRSFVYSFQQVYYYPKFLKHLSIFHKYSHSLVSSEYSKDFDFRINALDNVNEKNIDFLNSISPSLKKSFNLAAYVNHSETLKKLIELNVDLSKLEKNNDLASYLVKCDFKSDIEPLVLLLINNMIDIKNVGQILTSNPMLFMTHVDDIQCRINYFLFKKFSQSDISNFLTTAPKIFSLNTKTLDSNLGNLVQEYRLSAEKLRLVVRSSPKIVLLNGLQIKKCTFMFHEEMGFSENEIQSILLKKPYLWVKVYKNGRKGTDALLKVFNYVHNEMNVSHQQILQYPVILNRRVRHIQNRHLYLKALGRNQYDPTKALYVPLSAFHEIDDAEFCLRYSKTSVNDFNEFLKTI